MVSRLFGSNPLDDLIGKLHVLPSLLTGVDRATSEYLPAGQMDLALTLDVCDMIRSKQVPAKQALQSLKRRINHRNPNVQLLALNLTDTCVKNGGHHFLMEIASRDFMDFLLSLVNRQSGTTTEVRNRILSLVQNWAAIFKAKPDLGYVVEVYDQLRSEGYVFPPPEKVDPIMLDTSTPPDWSDSSACTRCRTPFTFTNRKHHCRNCGHTYCGQCSSYFVPLPHMGITQDVRVCTGCYLSLKKVTAPLSKPQQQHKPGYMLPDYPGSERTSSAYASKFAEQEDDDLKRAIELSLKESSQQQQPSHYPRSSSRYSKPTPVVEEMVVEDDPDLAAAIAASLMEAEQKQRQPSYAYRPSTPPVKSHRPPEYDEELTTVEAENILLFATLVDKFRDNTYASATIANDYALRDLYNQIGALRPKLIKGLEDTARKHRAYVELHEKLSTAQQMYDSMVSERLAANRMSQPFAGFNSQQPAGFAQYAPTSRPQTPYGVPSGQMMFSPPQSHQPTYAPPSAPPTYPPTHYPREQYHAPPQQPTYAAPAPTYPPQQQPYAQEQPMMQPPPPQQHIMAFPPQQQPQQVQQPPQLQQQQQQFVPPPPPPQQQQQPQQEQEYVDPQHVIHMPISPTVHQRNPFTANPSISTAMNGNYHEQYAPPATPVEQAPPPQQHYYEPAAPAAPEPSHETNGTYNRPDHPGRVRSSTYAFDATQRDFPTVPTYLPKAPSVTQQQPQSQHVQQASLIDL